jgi:hypothetical protein
MAVNARDAMNGDGHLIIAVRASDVIRTVRAHPEMVRLQSRSR